MAQNIAIVRISTPKELIAAGESLYNPWFRGHGFDKWRLESSLERDANNFGVPREALWEREQTMLTLFKERAHLYTSEFTTPTTEFEWFSLIRHYGGPSRMLDVTSSYLVAAYFALFDSQPKRDASIWAFQEAGNSEKEYPNFDTLFQCNHPLDLKIGSPNRLNIRLQAQSGKFFVPGSITASLESQIAEKFETDFGKKPTIYRSVNRITTERKHRIWKFVIPRLAHSKLFRFISRCNVRAYSLIPGIDGLAASLREMMRAYD